MTFAIINSVVTIKQKSGISFNFTSEVTNFKETGIERKVTYTPIIGGRILPKMENQDSQEVSFDFILTGSNTEALMGSNSWEFDLDTYNNNLNKIAIDFSSNSNFYTKRYYDCFITKFNVNPKTEVLQGTLEFSLPMKSMDGYSTVYSGSDMSNADLYDTQMGY